MQRECWRMLRPRRAGSTVSSLKKMGATFFAFAVETTGRLGQQALAFIRLIIQEAARYKSVWAPKEVVHGIYRSVAMAVGRGNNNVVQGNLFRSRLAEW